MQKIEVAVLNPEVVKEAEKMMVCAARLTQRGEKISDLKDFMCLYNKSYSNETVKNLCSLPHPTIQKFGVINVVVVGASRRFLAQITRHQNEVKFISASLQYSDYSDNKGADNFCIPYELLEKGDPNIIQGYLDECTKAMETYNKVREVAGNDAAGYAAPQALRNILIISATPYQWKHMISQRTCNRNTKETQYVMLKIWNELYKLSPELFSCGPFCMKGKCLEGKMCCGDPIPKTFTPDDILREKFPLCTNN